MAMMVASGCGDDSTAPVDSDPVLTVWLGTYEERGGDDFGAIMIDIVQEGHQVTAETVIRSRENEMPFDHLYLKGREDGGLFELGVDIAGAVDYFQFDVNLLSETDGTMTGTFYSSVYDLLADIELVELEQAETTVDTFVDLDAVATGIAYDGDHIWISTAGWDHFLMDTTTALVDTVAVFIFDDAHWTSDALTSDGNLLWGGFPVTVTDISGTREESDIVEFEKDGDLLRRFRIGHRTSGLAWSGDGLWSLPTTSDMLYRVDLQGAVLETVEIGVPDLVDIAFDGSDFWAIGWFMKRLYRISGSGDVLSVYHLPGEHGSIYPAGIAFDGERFWYSFSTTYFDTRIYGLKIQ